ncbi:hypothetical protein [Kribbella italica]|uniref:Tail terminator n=1 Tax=Kribbella italica TaxID=1540520 RepID=A0A7W9J1Z9_9ACTN|nr:hypothetical protein [Kribbella italica]MBB5833413.1 hypothetical protein [Kribbella italica]
MTTTLHPDVIALTEMHPVEDLLLELLPGQLPGVQVRSLIADHQEFPLVIPRRSPNFGEWGGDPRFLDAARINIHAMCDGVNGDEDAALLSEAVRVILRDSVNIVVPHRGHLVKVEMSSAPRRVTDWATATGPVQYADLPTGVTRYETVYDLVIRKPASTQTP